MKPSKVRGKFDYQRLYALARRIPKGQVASYGQLARMAGCSARVAGYAMAALGPNNKVPWQRVINARGEVSERSGGDGQAEQRLLLEAEGVVFNARGRVDLKACGWPGPSWAWMAANGYDPETAGPIR